MLLLEGDVVVGRRREVGALLLRRARRHELVAAATVSVAAAAEELDAVGDDLDRLALAAAVLRLPLAPAELAVDADRPALGQVLRAALGLVAEDGDAEVVGRVDPVARLVALAVVDCDAQAADGGSAGRVPQLRVSGQVPDQDDAVDVGCHVSTPPPRRVPRWVPRWALPLRALPPRQRTPARLPRKRSFRARSFRARPPRARSSRSRPRWSPP